VGLQSFQGNNQRFKGPNVSSGDILQGIQMVGDAGTQAIGGLDNIRRIGNKSSIMDLIGKSDSANYGDVLGQVSALAADTTADGAAAAQAGMGDFYKKASNDLTGLGKILTAYKPTKGASNSRTNLSYLGKVDAYNKMRGLKPVPTGNIAEDGLALRKWRADMTAAKSAVDNRAALVSGNGASAGSGDMGMMTEAAKTMNKYFDRKMGFDAVAAGGGGKAAPSVIEQIVQREQQRGPLEGPEEMPEGYKEPLDMFQEDGNGQPQHRPGVPIMGPFGKAPTIDKSKWITYKPTETDLIGKNNKFGPKPSVYPPKGKDLPEVEGKTPPKVKPKSFMEQLIPGWDSKTDAEKKADRKQAKIDARNEYNLQHGVRDIPAEQKAGPKRSKIGNILHNIKQGVKNIDGRDVANAGKGIVRGGVTASTGTGGGRTFYNESGEPLEQSMWDGFMGNTPEGAVYAKSEDELNMTPLSGFQREMAGTTGATPGFKPASANTGRGEPSEGGPSGGSTGESTKAEHVVEETPYGFSINFDDQSSKSQTSYNVLEARRALAELESYRVDATGPQRLEIDKKMQEAKAIISKNRGNTAIDRGMANIRQNSRKYNDNNVLLPRNSRELVDDLSGDADTKKILSKVLSPRSKTVLDNILQAAEVEKGDGKFAVTIGGDSAIPGFSDPVSLAGDSRIDVASQYLQMMLQMGQSSDKTREFVNTFPESKRQAIYDQVNLDSHSVKKSDRSNPWARNFRNSEVPNASMTPDFSDSDMIDAWLFENIKG